MTTPQQPEQPRPQLRLDDPGQVISAVPHLLGFHPTDSLVLVTLVDRDGLTLGPLQRVDLPPARHYGFLVDQLVDNAVRAEIAAAIVLVVEATTTDPPDPLPHSELVRRFADAFARAEIGIAHALWVPRIDGEPTWRCYEDCCRGTVPDPATSPVASVAARSGMVTYASRDELAAQFDPDPAADLARRSTLLDAAMSAEPEPGGPDAYGYLTMLVEHFVDRAATDQQPLVLTDEQVVDLAIALSNPDIRSACLRMALGDRRGAAERLWRRLACALPMPERAEAACLLAVCAYLRGDCTVAHIATDVALTAHPGHELALLIRLASAHCVPPEQFRALLGRAVERAGVDLDGVSDPGGSA